MIKTMGALALLCIVLVSVSMTGCSKDTTPPQITNLEVNGVAKNGCFVSWITDEPATSQIEFRSGDFGLTTDYNLSTILDSNLVTKHSVALMDICPNTTYHYAVVSVDKAGNRATSSDLAFTTTPEQVLTDLEQARVELALARAAIELVFAEGMQGILSGGGYPKQWQGQSGVILCNGHDAAESITAGLFKAIYTVEETGDILGATNVSWSGVAWDTSSHTWKSA